MYQLVKEKNLGHCLLLGKFKTASRKAPKNCLNPLPLFQYVMDTFRMNFIIVHLFHVMCHKTLFYKCIRFSAIPVKSTDEQAKCV